MKYATTRKKLTYEHLDEETGESFIIEVQATLRDGEVDVDYIERIAVKNRQNVFIDIPRYIWEARFGTEFEMIVDEIDWEPLYHTEEAECEPWENDYIQHQLEGKIDYEN